MERPIATRSSWKAFKPMPVSKANIPFSMSFDPAEYDCLKRGLVPFEMEDKWFIFFEDEIVNFHRSWTGICIFQLRIGAVSDRYAVVEAWANRDSTQYNSPSVGEELALLQFLVDTLLLGKDVSLSLAASGDTQAIARHNLVGYGTPAGHWLGKTPVESKSDFEKLLASVRGFFKR